MRRYTKKITLGLSILILGLLVSSSASAIQTGQPYILSNVWNRLCIDVENGSSTNGTNVRHWGCSLGPAQQWYFDSTGDGYYLVRNAATGKCLDVYDFSTSAGGNIALWDCHGATNQHFSVVDVASGGVVRIVSRLSGMALEAWEWGTAYNTNLVQWPVSGYDNQHFYAQIAGTVTSGCPSPPETITVNSTIVVPAGTVYDGGCRRYIAGSAVGDGSQAEGQDPVFRLEAGATLLNVVVGAPAADGIHTYGNATLSNITWEDVGEDAMTIKESGTVNLIGGYARYAADKIFQINAASTFNVYNFTAYDGGKFIRQLGGSTFHVDVYIDSCDISYMDEAIFRTDSSTSTVTMVNTRYSNIGDELFMGVSSGNITTSNNTAY